MSRSQTRARNRCARLNTILSEIEFAMSAKERVAAIESLRKFFANVEVGGGKVWPFLKQIEGCYPPDKYGDEERMVIRAMVADVVAPWLSGSTRGSVDRRYYYAKVFPKPCREPKAYGLNEENNADHRYQFGK